VYLHFPWCRKRCPYCDFAVETGDPPHAEYLAAILRELDARADAFPGELVSIYLGGGTPSLWEPDCIAEAIAAIRRRYGAAPREVTIEANPTDCTPAILGAWRAAGVTRVSIGIQSHDPAALIVLGRDHRFGDGTAAVRAALDAGLVVSTDFILGTPTGTVTTPAIDGERTLAGNAAAVLDGAVHHMSVYELTIEERTAFGQRVRDGRLTPLSEDTLADLYVATHERLTAAGYEHYEISSYARPGYRAVHNSLYWRGCAFLGLGVGAASLQLLPDGSGRRATNPRRAVEYLAAPGTPAEVVEETPAELAAERAWLGLRTLEGVAMADLAPAAGVAEWGISEGLLVQVGGRITPTLRGFLFADRIASRIVQDWGGSR